MGGGLLGEHLAELAHSDQAQVRVLMEVQLGLGRERLQPFVVGFQEAEVLGCDRHRRAQLYRICWRLTESVEQFFD